MTAVKLTATITPQSIGVTVNPATVGVGFSPPVARDFMDRDPYEGEYSITPSGEEQTIAIQGKWARHDIVVQPIPSNYGLITWNGAILTVS